MGKPKKIKGITFNQGISKRKKQRKLFKKLRREMLKAERELKKSDNKKNAPILAKQKILTYQLQKLIQGVS